MISKTRIKWIKSLELRKNRIAQQLFVAEGPKLVGELLHVFRPRYVAALPDWMEENEALLQNCEKDEVCHEELERASFLRTPQSVLAVFPIQQEEINYSEISNQLCLALDGVQDPGNLGTIVRIADWFGIRHIFCSPDTADIYNPKAVQATMGGLAHVQLHYTALPTLLAEANVPVYGTFLDGENIYHQPLENHGIIVMGNEGKGISKDVEECVNQRLYIPNYPAGRESTESLNVAVATSIVCAEFRRRFS